MLKQQPSHGEDRRSTGLSLIELLVALTLGLFLLALVIGVFVDSKRNLRQDEQLARMQESARFSFSLMTRDLRMAGYFGGRLPVYAPTTWSGVGNDNCLKWATNATEAVSYRPPALPAPTKPASPTMLDCFPANAPPPAGTAVLGIKRTEGRPTDSPVENGLYIQTLTPKAHDSSATYGTDGGDWYLQSDGGDPPSNRQLWEYQVHLYYISLVDGEPWLSRRSLVAGPEWLVEERFVEGIENFALELGADTTHDGLADLTCYGLSTDPAGCPATTLTKDMVTGRLYVLSRSPEKDRSTRVSREYTYGRIGTTDNKFKYGSSNSPQTVYSDQYFRRVYTTSVPVWNHTYGLITAGMMSGG